VMTASEPYELDEQHLHNVLTFNDDSRYAYFIARVCDSRRVYGLVGEDDGWLVWGNVGDDGAEVFPAWPHPRLAELAAADDFDGFHPQGTDLDAFMLFCDDLQEDEVLVGVLPFPDGSQLVVEARDLKRDLEDFLGGVYDDVTG
jgi:hypothetical protein